MEPRIIKGHLYKCKKTVKMNRSKEVAYTKGNVYMGVGDVGYPGDKHNCGFIKDNTDLPHAWPYDPEHHLWCHDSWTDYFDDMGEA